MKLNEAYYRVEEIKNKQKERINKKVPLSAKIMWPILICVFIFLLFKGFGL